MVDKSHSAEEAELTQASATTTPIYELGYHVVPTVGEDGLEAVVEKLRSQLKDAEIISEQKPERMTLSYTIERAVQGKREKYESSYFGWIKFALEDKSELAAIQTAIRSMQEVLRFLIISTVREDTPAPRRAVFTSTRLEGETIKKPEVTPEKSTDVSEEELDKSIDAIVATE